MAPRVGVRDSSSTLSGVAPRVGVRDSENLPVLLRKPGQSLRYYVQYITFFLRFVFVLVHVICAVKFYLSFSFFFYISRSRGGSPSQKHSQHSAQTQTCECPNPNHQKQTPQSDGSRHPRQDSPQSDGSRHCVGWYPKSDKLCAQPSMSLDLQRCGLCENTLRFL